MQHRYIKLAYLALGVVVVASFFSLATVKFLRPTPKIEILLRDMISSYTFKEDVFKLMAPALNVRLESWANHLYDATHQPTCLSSKFLDFQEKPDVNVSVCSTGTKLSELAKATNDSGSINIQLGENELGEIEWLTQSEIYFPDFFGLFAFYLLFLLLMSTFMWWLFHPRNLPKMPETKLTTADLFRSLYRIMGNNRRILAFHDNWVYGKREHPYINFINLDGSRLKLRASMSDISTLFPGTRFINRSEIVNISVGAHQIKGQQVVIATRTGELKYDIDMTYKDCNIIEALDTDDKLL